MTASGFVRAFAEQHKTRPNRPFCWVLGAGASVSSGIPTATELARDFLRTLCFEHTGSDRDLDGWIASGAHGIAGLEPANPARHYPEIYHARFGDCPDAGYAYLEEVMRNKTPSYGYAILAWLLAKTAHRIVITTNFDNLVADSLATHAQTFPRVVGHVELTEFVQTDLRRPLIAKIHGDLGFRMLNTSSEISKPLDDRWLAVLKQVFQRCTPVVIGYGGNDQTLMGMLRDLPSEIPDRIYWCQRSGSSLSGEVCDFLAKRAGARLVSYPGFDELMVLLADHLNTESALAVPDLVADLAANQQKQLEALRLQRTNLGASVAKTDNAPAEPSSRESEAGEERRALSGAASRVLAQDALTKEWWHWVLVADKESDVDRKDALYREGVSQLPNSPELLGSYANFLRDERRDLDRAEEFYKRSLDADPTHAHTLGNYAIFLCDERRDLDRAERFYKRAVDANPKHANNLNNYAIFLRYERRDLDHAEEFYRRAVDADPKHANTLGEYANFLCVERRDIDRARELFKRAVDADPRNANNLGNYAQVLFAIGRDSEAWEHLGRARALLTPSDKALAVELAFYRAAHDVGSLDGSLRELRKLLEAGNRSPKWSFGSNIERAMRDGHPEPALLHALASVISDSAPLALLEDFPRWAEAKG